MFSLSREVMGLLCLGVLWVTALLVAGAAWQELRDLRALARRARGAIRATITRGDGEGGALAEWSVEQTGRALDGSQAAIAFHDRTFASRIFGGEVRSGDATFSVAAQDGQVWPSEEGRARAAACAGVQEFDGAYALARKAKGFHREVRVPLREGDEVFVIGLGGADKEPLVVSAIDPLRFCATKSRAVVMFILAELAACGVVTRIAWTPPHFGTVSVVGAVLGIAFFLGVTPLGVALRESARVPSVAYLRGTWTRAAQAPDEAPAPARG